LTQPNSVTKRAFSVIGDHFLILWMTALWPYLLLAAVYISIAVVRHAGQAADDQTGTLLERVNSLTLGVRLLLLLAFVAGQCLPADLSTAGVSYLVWAALHGEEVRLGLIWPRLAGILVRLVILSLSIAILGFAGSLFILPGIAIFLFTSFVVPVVAIENAGISTALRVGVRYAKSQFVPLFLLLILIGIAAIVFAVGVVFVVTSLADYPWWVGVSGLWAYFTVLASLLMMTRSTIVTVLYKDSREKAENPTMGIS